MRLIKSFSLITIGNAMVPLAQWLLVIAVSRQFGSAAMGDFTLYISLLAPAFILSGLGVRQLYITDSLTEPSCRGLYWLRCILFAFCFVIMILYLCARKTEGIEIFVIMYAIKGLELAQELAHSVWQKKEKFNNVGKSLVYRSLSTFICIVLMVFGLPFEQSIIIQLFISLFVFFTFDVKAFENNDKALFFGFAPYCDIKVLRQSFYITSAAFLLSLYVNVPRYVLDSVEGSEALASFMAVIFVIFTLRVFVQSLSQVALPKLSKAYNMGDIFKFKSHLLMLVLLVIGLVLLLAIASHFYGKSAISLIYGDAVEVDLLELYFGLAYGLVIYTASVLNVGLTAIKGFKDQFILTFVVCVICIISSMLLIPNWGSYGAYGALLISASIQMLWTYRSVMVRASNLEYIKL